MDASQEKPTTSTATALARDIVSTSGTCGGRPRLDGTRIQVQDIAIWYERQGLSPDEIVAGWPDLSLADVHAALTYYYGHRAEIERQIKDDREFSEKLRAGQPSILEKARRGSGGNDSLSS